MLFLHETHTVSGRREEDFEAAVRDVWQPALAARSGVRLLYFLRHAHGTGASYRVVTITAVRDAAAWGELAERVAGGDLRRHAAELDDLRHGVTGKILSPLPWSPLREVDLSALPTRGAPHPATLYMEDTVWPREGLLERYIEAAGSHYAREMEEQRGEGGGRGLLEVQGGFRTAFGAGRRDEVVLWQKVVRPEGMVPLLMHEVPARYRKPGTWMHDALALRDRWESRLLRTASWSPLF